MPTPNSSEPLVDGDLEVELASYNGKTMSVRRIKFGGKLRFNNKKNPKKLLIMSPAADPPFVLAPGATAVSWFEVGPKDTRDVHVSDVYQPVTQFTYTAVIDGSGAEDPIVIIDRR